MEELLRESSPINQATVEIPSFPYMTGAVGYAESDTSDSESESNSPQTPITGYEDEVGEIDEFFDVSETRTPHALPTPGGMKEFLQSNPISIQITSFGNH